MIKALLSDKKEVTEYIDGYSECYLYLAYVKTRGYILIEVTKSNTWFYPIKSDKAPDYLSVNWEYDLNEIKDIGTTFESIFKDYIASGINGDKGNTVKIIEDLIDDIVDDLLGDLSEKLVTDSFTKVANAPNDEIKEFLLAPVDVFNNYSENIRLTEAEAYETTETVKNEIDEHIKSILTLFNENKYKTYVNRHGEEKELFKDTDLLTTINKIARDSIKNPILNLSLGTGTKDINKLNAVAEVISEFNIKRSFENNTETNYCFNDELNYYEKLPLGLFKNKIYKTYGFPLLESDLSGILKAIATEDTMHDNLLVFKNMLFDTDYLEELNAPLCKYDRRDYLTINRVGFEDPKNKNHIQLLDYDNDLCTSDFLKVKDIPDDDVNVDVKDYKTIYGMTYTEKAFRQILIPKTNPTDLRLFKDTLERIGSCIYGENLYKVITLYFGDGDNAKSFLKFAIELIYNVLSLSIVPESFEDKFNLDSFKNRKVVHIDEIDANSFDNLKPELKRKSSRYSKIEQRQMYSSETTAMHTFPNIFIYANVLINLTMEDLALFRRLDFLELPNKFVEAKELHKYENAYLLDEDAEDKLRNDVDGLSWLITASILCFKDMKERKATYTLRQTTEESMDIWLKSDYLTKFIKIYTETSEDIIQDDYVTTAEIISKYKQYMKLQNKTITETEVELSRQIGNKIKQVYNIHGKIKHSDMYYKRDNSVATYKLRLKTFDEISKQYKQAYVINEDVSGAELSALEYSSDNKLIYKKIQQGINTINQLSKEYPDLNILQIVKELESLNLIYNSFKSNLEEL